MKKHETMPTKTTESSLAKHIAALFFACFFIDVSHSQAILSGTVTDANKVPIDYFDVLLLSTKDSSILHGASCFDGSFSIESKSSGALLLKVSSVGYESEVSPVFVSPDGARLHVGDITLNPKRYSLDEAVVSAKRPVIVSKADRIIVNVQGSILSSVSDGMEMLQKTPGLIRNGEGNIAVVGRGEPVIYIDGKQIVSMLEVEMLNPQNIKSIEILDNPPASFDASGHAVVLINTIKKADDYFVRFGNNYTQARKVRDNVFVEGQFSKKKVGANLYYGFSNNESKGFEDNRRYTRGSDMAFSHSQGFDHTQRHQYRASADYVVSPKHTLGIQCNGYYSASDANREQSTKFTDLTSTGFMTYSRTQEDSHQIDGTLYYNFVADSFGRNLKIVADATKNGGYGHQRFYNRLDDEPTDIPFTPFMNHTVNDGTARIYSVKADYLHPVGKRWTFDVGGKYYLIDRDHLVSQSGSVNSEQPYGSNEQNIALYLSASVKLNEKMNIRAGLRTESNFRKGERDGVDFVNISATDFFPSLLFDYKISEKATVGLSYTKRIVRPHLSFLDPALVVDSLMSRKGNPDLRSTTTNAVQLSLGLLNRLNIRIGYNHSLNPFYFMFYQDEENPRAAKIRYENEKRSGTYWLAASYDENILNRLSVSSYGGLWKEKYKYVEAGEIKYNDKLGWYAGILATYVLPWELNLDVGFDYYGGGSSGTLVMGKSWELYASLRKSFFNNNLICRLYANDIFNTTITPQQSVLTGKNLNVYDSDMTYIRFGISYQFGKSKAQFKSKSGNEEEKNRL